MSFLDFDEMSSFGLCSFCSWPKENIAFLKMYKFQIWCELIQKKKGLFLIPGVAQLPQNKRPPVRCLKKCGLKHMTAVDVDSALYRGTYLHGVCLCRFREGLLRSVFARTTVFPRRSEVSFSTPS